MHAWSIRLNYDITNKLYIRSEHGLYDGGAERASWAGGVEDGDVDDGMSRELGI